ncbi:MAG TPA: porin [Sphingomicrobium sp.]|nr:porin [Sphingomicrobium sp.]
MIGKSMFSALLAGSAFVGSAPAIAQQVQPSPPSSAAAPGDGAHAKIEMLEAQIKALQDSIEALKTQVAATAPAWKGAPQFADKESGWSFKPRGRLMYDFGHVSSPDGFDNAGLGFSNEVRRARLGVEGTMPGDLGYRFEIDAAAGEVEIVDAFLTYAPADIEFTLGQHNNFQSLEEVTSSLHTSFIERAAFTDAFGFERRVGLSAQYSKGPLLLQGGVFTDNIADLNAVGDDNDSYGFDTRAVYMPKMGENQLHFAASYHWRDINDAGTSVRYRQRPAIHTTDVRFIDTGNLEGAKTETGYGVEAAGIFGPFHVASEAYWQEVGRETDLGDASFFGAYVEAGFFLTGESRGYKAGKFDRVKVKRPFGAGGIGAVSVNARWDYLDLTDGDILGGKQNAYQVSLNWKPTDYVLFGLNYGRINYDGALATPEGDRSYTVDMVGLRSQIDF